jgi:dienelactone hydrolase
MRQSLCMLLTCPIVFSGSASSAEPLPGTKPLTWEGDIASKLIDACDAFLLRRLEESVKHRPQYWVPQDKPVKERKPDVERLKHLLGLRDPRIPFDGLELVATTSEPAVVGKVGERSISRVRWPAFGGVHGEGLFLNAGPDATAWAIVLPDADQTPEQLCGLTEGIPAGSRLPLTLVSSGVNVVVPALISREMVQRNNRATLSHREYIHRSAFVLGRTMTGYEVQKVLALVDWMERENEKQQARRPISVAGYGEGGMIALYSAAVDPRIDVTLVSGYLGSQDNMWQEPISRNVFGVLREYGDAELAFMIKPRELIIEESVKPELTLSGSGGGAPATLDNSIRSNFLAFEFGRLIRYSNTGKREEQSRDFFTLIKPTFDPESKKVFLSRSVTQKLCEKLNVPMPETDRGSIEKLQTVFREQDRLARQIAELDRHNQELLNESPFVRKEFMKDLDTSSLEAYEKSAEKYREIFRRDIIGEFDLPLEKFNARSRRTWETDAWTGYEVVVDVFDGVFAYGVLLVPKGIGADEKRPVVVCQHGLEGRPTDVFLDDHRAYHDYAAKLAERGFITFAPQNIYIFKDRFRTLQRKAYPLGKTLFSIMVPQHQQIVNWLKTQPNVDPERIAFYGLSYGGKSAMRIPALVTDYCLSICSADFNEWVHKNASTRYPFSYVWTGEYEIFEWDLGSTFNYAEMAALIAPRPFMVERGHFDGVGWDEWVAYEYAKVRFLYAAKLHIPDRTEIEFFDGPHTIHGQGTFRFLHQHLNWPEPETK